MYGLATMDRGALEVAGNRSLADRPCPGVAALRQCPYWMAGSSGGTGPFTPRDEKSSRGQRPPHEGKQCTTHGPVWRFINRWLLAKRGWDAEIAMMVIEMGPRLDGPSIIDLIADARPGGRYGDRDD